MIVEMGIHTYIIKIAHKLNTTELNKNISNHTF